MRDCAVAGRGIAFQTAPIGCRLPLRPADLRPPRSLFKFENHGVCIVSRRTARPRRTEARSRMIGHLLGRRSHLMAARSSINRRASISRGDPSARDACVDATMRHVRRVEPPWHGCAERARRSTPTGRARSRFSTRRSPSAGRCRTRSSCTASHIHPRSAHGRPTALGIPVARRAAALTDAAPHGAEAADRRAAAGVRDGSRGEPRPAFTQVLGVRDTEPPHEARAPERRGDLRQAQLEASQSTGARVRGCYLERLERLRQGLARGSTHRVRTSACFPIKVSKNGGRQRQPL